MVKRALTIARFQPFHAGHYRLLKIIKKDGYDEIIMGIGSSNRFRSKRNPFTCSEIAEMIEPILKEVGFKKYFIVPIPDVKDDDVWVLQIIRLAPRFDAVYGSNSLVNGLFKKEGYRVVNIDRKDMKVCGTMIREMIAKGNPRWKELVPRKVYEKILEIDGVRKIKKLYKKR